MSDDRWSVATLALAGAALVLLFAVVPHGMYGDGYVRFLKLDALVRHGALGPERYSYIGPLFASPLWVFGDSRAWWCARFNVFVLAAGALGVWWTMRSALTAAERANAILLLTAAGMMPQATRDFFGDAFTAVSVGTGLMAIAATGRWLGWLAVVLGVANAPATIVGLLLVALWRLLATRRIDGFIALGAATALILLENTLVRGAPLNSGYAGDHGNTTVLPFSGMSGFSYPFIFGLLSLLFSFGKGLLFFAPGLLLVARARRAHPKVAQFLDLSVAFLVGLLLIYSKWWAWYGGWTWGPRFLLFAVYPSSIAIAVLLRTATTRWRTAAAVAIACWTVWVGVSGVVFGLDGLDDCIANGYALEHLCWYVPDYSPLLRPLILRAGPLPAWGVAWMALAACALGVLITPLLARTAEEHSDDDRLDSPGCG
jgi:hypothetical protein